MRIVIETIPHDQQRYPTVGDWWFDELGVQVRVSSTDDPRDAMLIALHELVEAMLCNHRGISEAAVTEFDLDHVEAASPGDLPAAPYHKEHVFAETVERLMAQQLGRNWQEYETALAALDA